MSLPYSLATLWHERNRFLPAVLAVAFSALLIAVQLGSLLASLAVTSSPIDHSSADVWVGIGGVPSIELSHPIPESWLLRLEATPEVAAAESYLYNFSDWRKPEGGAVNVCVIGARLDKDALGVLRDLSPELRTLLTEPGAVVVDGSELKRLGLKRGVGEIAEIAGQRVRVVGLVHGFKGIWGPYIFCSHQTARMVLPMYYREEQTQYVLARCQPGQNAVGLVDLLRRKYPEMGTFTRDEFSVKTRVYWLTQTRVGIAMGLTSALALLVGLVVTSQTLYAATAASLREYAVLSALGIPRWRMSSMVVIQSFWIGLVGVLVSMPAVQILGQVAERVGSELLLPSWLLGGTASVTMLIALLSGLAALRSLRMIEPAVLLR